MCKEGEHWCDSSLIPVQRNLTSNGIETNINELHSQLVRAVQTFKACNQHAYHEISHFMIIFFILMTCVLREMVITLRRK